MKHLIKTKTFSIILLNTLISFSFYGCSHHIPEPKVASSEALAQLNQLGQADSIPETMRMTTRIDYVDEINKKRVVGQDLIVSASAPQNMRITLSAFDKAISTMVTDGAGFSLMNVSENIFITGPATPENIAQILPIYLSAADLYRVITGSYPTDNLAPDAENTQTFAWDESEGGYCRTLPLLDGKTQRVYHAWPSGDIFKITVSSNNGTEYIYEASDFEEYSWQDKTLRYPKTIIFKLIPQKTDVRLRVETRDLDVEFSPAVFRLVPPANTRVVIMDERLKFNAQ